MADDWAEVGPVVAAVRDFERENPDVRVQIQPLPFSQIIGAVRSGVETGQPYDIAHGHAFAAGAQGLAEPLDDLWEAHLDPDEFFAGAIEDVTWASRRYGVPLDVNALMLIANADLLAEHGFELDDGLGSFAEMRTAAEAVTSDDATRRGIAIAHSSWSTFGWISANGGELVSVAADGTPAFSLDAPAVVEAMEFLGALVRDDLAFPPITRNTSADSYELFRAGSTALHASGTWDLAQLETAGGGEDYRTMLLPQGRDDGVVTTVLGGSSLFVPKGSEHRELAFAFMRHLTSDDYALDLAEQEGRLPVRSRVYDAPMFDAPAYRLAVEQLDHAVAMKLIAFPRATEHFTRAVDGILTGSVDAQPALAEAQRATEQAYAAAGG